jgi:hypothetical protein
MKNMLLAVSFFTLSACAMEKENKQKNQWNVTVKNTKINLYKANILESGDGNKADVIVVKYGKIDEHFLLNNKNKLVTVNGPEVSVSPYLDVFYERSKPYKLYHAKLFRKDAPYSVDEVVAEALKDLKLCYTDIFTQAVQERNEKIAKSIALPALCIGSYKSHFPNNCDLENKAMQCTITTMLEFIKNHPNAYDSIELFVEGDFEFNVCRKLLEIIT